MSSTASSTEPTAWQPTTNTEGLALDTTQVSDAMRQISVASDTAGTMSSAPRTPGSRPSSARRTSQTAMSPGINNSSPREPPMPIRRASGSASMERPLSSPKLARKESRSSMGGLADESEKRPTPKRSISNLISGLRESHSTMEAIQEPTPLSAAQIATEHFGRELRSHEQGESVAETCVILHDACYGHRWSRLKTTKAQLSLIVERPERISASALGTSAAYVRLAGHHAGARNAPHPSHHTSSSPPFTIKRSTRSIDVTSTCVTNVHGTAWMAELRGMCDSAASKLAMGQKELSRTTAPGEPEKQKLHEGDLYLAAESLNAFQGALGGVADAIDTVFAPNTTTKRAFVAVRPPGHHCSADHPSGFCWLNNVHVGIEYAAQTYGLTHAAILDFDLHHGDGSQAIAWERNSKNNDKRVNAKPNSKLKLSPDIGYYSLHDINSYPCEMGDTDKVQAASLCIENAHSQSIWNVHLRTWKNEDEFWRLYEERYRILLDKAKVFLEHYAAHAWSERRTPPKAAVFISAGFDASEWEGTGMQRHTVNVPTEFYARFTQDVVDLARTTPGCDGRVISVLEGGYSDRALCSGVLSHLSGLCVSPVTPKTKGVDALLGQLNGLSIDESKSAGPVLYDKDWWSAANLTALEHKINPPPPPQSKKGRTGPQPTYATPTESFAYKVVDVQKFARSVSGTMREAPTLARAPTPPPPEVDWVVATQELSKLLIPTHRQTKSCTPEELAVPRAKHDRQSTVPALSTEEAGRPRQLRDRRTKAPIYAESAHSDDIASVRTASRSESRASRRETIDVLPTDVAGNAALRRASRRSSTSSTHGFSKDAVDADAPPVPSLPQSAMADGNMKPPPIPTPSLHTNNSKVRAAPQPRVRGASASAPSSPATSKISKPPPIPSGKAAAERSSEVDVLTSGMKKVSLKVSTSKEEHDRKQKEKLDAERRARALKGAETRRVNAAARKAAKEGTATETKSKAQPAVIPSATAPQGELKENPAVPPQLSNLAVGEKHEHKLGFSQKEVGTLAAAPPVATITTDTPKPTVDVKPGVEYVASQTQTAMEMPASFGAPAEDLDFPEYANSGGSGSISPALPAQSAQAALGGSSPYLRPSSAATSTAPSSIAGSGPHVAEPSPSSMSSWPLTAQPGVTGTLNERAPDDSGPVGFQRPSASPIRPSSKGNLPVWSATGHIPFAAAPSSTKGTEHADGKSIWDVPDTPSK